MLSILGIYMLAVEVVVVIVPVEPFDRDCLKSISSKLLKAYFVTKKNAMVWKGGAFLPSNHRIWSFYKEIDFFIHEKHALGIDYILSMIAFKVVLGRMTEEQMASSGLKYPFRLTD